MSWAEVKKFLNKRSDKALNEIIEESTHCSNVMSFTTSEYGKFNNATKTFTGRGRVVLYFDKSDGMKISIDGGAELTPFGYALFDVYFKESIVIKNTNTGGYYAQYMVFFE